MLTPAHKQYSFTEITLQNWAKPLVAPIDVAEFLARPEVPPTVKRRILKVGKLTWGEAHAQRLMQAQILIESIVTL
jgi:hypothetical protein